MFGICIVEDEKAIREGLTIIIENHLGSSVYIYEADNGSACIELLSQFPIKLIITDIRMEGLNGIEMMEQINKQRIEAEFIVLSGYDDFKYCQKALHLGAIDYLLKPVDEEELIRAVNKALHRIKTENDDKGTYCKPEFRKLINDIMEYIKENYSSGITLDTLAEKFHYNPVYLSLLFKKTTGIKFVDYLNRVRIQNAKRLLLRENIGIEQVAFQVGFKDHAYFARLFKKMEGYTPSDYRNH
jgi:YesN/AraC family two-component response regulator